MYSEVEAGCIITDYSAQFQQVMTYLVLIDWMIMHRLYTSSLHVCCHAN